MQLQQASRKNTSIKMVLQGPSGSGKTYGALLIAYGLCNDWSKVAVIDTENRSSELYAHLGRFFVLHLQPPFTPERYIEAITLCEQSGIQVIIQDSISHEWDGIGGILDIHSQMTGNSYTNWARLTPRHNAFVQKMLQSRLHIISTIRSKQDYILTERNGKQVPEKVGMKGITRDGMDYEFTLVFELNMKNKAVATKDRTSVFMGKPEFTLTPEVGRYILHWCQQGIPEPDEQVVLLSKVNACQSIDELLRLYHAYPTQEEILKAAFTARRLQLEAEPGSSLIIHQQNKHYGINGSVVTTATAKRNAT